MDVMDVIGTIVGLFALVMASIGIWKMRKIGKRMKIDYLDCPYCGQLHKDLEYTELEQPSPITEVFGDKFMAVCPAEESPFWFDLSDKEKE